MKGFSFSINKMKGFSFSINMMRWFSFSINKMKGFSFSINKMKGFSFSINMIMGFSFSINSMVVYIYEAFRVSFEATLGIVKHDNNLKYFDHLAPYNVKYIHPRTSVCTFEFDTTNVKSEYL